MTKLLFQITPLDCASYGKKIEDYLNDQKGIVSVKVFHRLGKVRIVFDETKENAEQFAEVIENLGYTVRSKKIV